MRLVMKGVRRAVRTAGEAARTLVCWATHRAERRRAVRNMMSCVLWVVVVNYYRGDRLMMGLETKFQSLDVVSANPAGVWRLLCSLIAVLHFAFRRVKKHFGNLQ